MAQLRTDHRANLYGIQHAKRLAYHGHLAPKVVGGQGQFVPDGPPPGVGVEGKEAAAATVGPGLQALSQRLTAPAEGYAGEVVELKGQAVLVERVVFGHDRQRNGQGVYRLRNCVPDGVAEQNDILLHAL